MILLRAFVLNGAGGNTILKQKSHRKNCLYFIDVAALTSTWVQVWVHVSPRSLTGHQLILEGRDPAADVRGRSCLHEEGALRQSEAAHQAMSVLLLRQQ